MKYFRLLTLSAIGLAWLATAGLETVAAQAPEEETRARRTCRIVFPERPNTAPKFAWLFDGKQSQRVDLPSMNFSPVIALPSGELTLVMTATEITDPENLPPGAPRIVVGENSLDFYILMTPDPSNRTLPLRMSVVDTSDGRLKPGETLWFNLTDHRIAARLGDSTMTVPPRGRTVSRSPVASSGYYRAEFGYQPQAEGGLQRITEQQWWHDTGSRHVGFIVNTGGRLPKIYFFRDFRTQR